MKSVEGIWRAIGFSRAGSLNVGGGEGSGYGAYRLYALSLCVDGGKDNEWRSDVGKISCWKSSD